LACALPQHLKRRRFQTVHFGRGFFQFSKWLMVVENEPELMRLRRDSYKIRRKSSEAVTSRYMSRF
jgi:hypothetical protein